MHSFNRRTVYTLFVSDYIQTYAVSATLKDANISGGSVRTISLSTFHRYS